MAAGDGERMKPLTEKTPKPFLLFEEKELIKYSLEFCYYWDIPKIIISTKSEYVKHLSDLDHETQVYINNSGVNGSFVNMNLKGLWLVLCADVIIDFNLPKLYRNVKEKGRTFYVTPVKNDKKVTHRVVKEATGWTFSENGTHILSGVSVIDFNRFNPELYENHDLGNMWEKALNYNDIGFCEIKPSRWRCFDYVEDFNP